MTEIVAEIDRLILKEWGEGDGDRFYAIMNTEPVMRHLGGVQDREKWEAALGRFMACRRDFGHTFWLVERKADGQLLGFCGLKRVNSPGTDLSGQFEIAWRLRESAWGKGYAKEAAIASLDLAFGRFGAPHVIAMTVPLNVASQGLMKRLGMVRRVELDFQDPRFAAQTNPWMVYSIEADVWPAARAAALG